MDRAADGDLSDIAFGGDAEPAAQAETQTEGTQDNLAFCRGLIQELADVRKKLAKRGVDPLVEREQEIRQALKERMAEAGLERVPDPKTMLAARLTTSYSEIYDAEVLEPLLTPAQRKRCLVTVVDAPVVKKLVETGALDFETLVKEGAVTRKLRAKSLYIDRIEE